MNDDSCSQTLLKQMSAEGPQASRMSVDTGPFNFHYIIEGPVCYLTLTGDLCTNLLLFRLHHVLGIPQADCALAGRTVPSIFDH